MAFYTFSQLIDGLGGAPALKHSEIAALAMRAAWTPMNTTVRNEIYQLLVDIDSGWDQLMQTQRGRESLARSLRVVEQTIPAASRNDFTYAINNIISNVINIAALGIPGYYSGAKQTLTAALQSIPLAINQATQNIGKGLNPFIDPLTGKESDIWKSIKWPLIIGGGAIALMVIVTYALPLLKTKKGGKK